MPPDNQGAGRSGTTVVLLDTFPDDFRHVTQQKWLVRGLVDAKRSTS